MLWCVYLQLPAMPVIDINKLPKYGVLSAPLPRGPKLAGSFIEYDRRTQIFAKNRGYLREAMEHKSGGDMHI